MQLLLESSCLSLAYAHMKPMKTETVSTFCGSSPTVYAARWSGMVLLQK